MRLLRGLVVCALMIAAGCAADRHPAEGCTDIGCVDGVSVQLGTLATRFPDTPLTIHMCVDDACQDAIVSDGSCQQVDLPPGGPTPALVLLCFPDHPGNVTLDGNVVGGLSGKTQVTLALSITDAKGVMVYEHSEVVSLSTSQPNGATCEPTCHEGSVVLAP